MQPVVYIVIGLVVLVVAVILTWKLSVSNYQKKVEATVGSAEVRANEIVDQALKTAETKKREALLEAKEEALRTKNELEREAKERRAEVQLYEKRVLTKEEALDKKTEALERKEAKISAKEATLDKLKAEVEEIQAKRLQELEKISGLTTDQAKEYLLKTVEDEVKHETAVLLKQLETRAKEEAAKKPKAKQNDTQKLAEAI